MIFTQGQDLKKLEQHFSADIINRYNESLKNNESALQIYDEILKKEPRFLPAYNNKSEILIRKNEENEAVKTIKAGLDIINKDKELENIFGKNVLYALRLNLAIASKKLNYNSDIIAKILQNWPAKPNGIPQDLLVRGSFLYGESLFQLSKYAEAVPHLEISSSFFTKPEEQNYIQNLLANSYYFSGQFDKALPYFDKLVNDNSSFELRQRKGMVYLRAGKYKQAENILTHLLEEYLEKSGRRESLEKFLQEINQKKYAQLNVEDIDNRIKKLEQSKDQEIEKEMGFLYLFKGEYNRAKSLLEKSVHSFSKKIGIK